MVQKELNKWDIVDVTVHRSLPVEPDIFEWMKRVTRWGMADILIQLGEDVGPKPEDKIHVFHTEIGGVPRIFISQELFDRHKQFKFAFLDQLV